MPNKQTNSSQKNAILKTIGANIKQARTSQNITQDKLAELLNTSVNFISLVERGQSGITIVNIVNICNALNIEPNALFNNTINPNANSNSQLQNSLSLLNKEQLNIVQSLINYMLNN